MGLKSNRWAILTVCLIVGLTLGILYAFSIFTKPLEASFGWTRTQTTMTFSWIMIFLSLGMITGGDIMARIGPKATASIGGLLMALGFFMASYTDSLLWLYISYGALAGYGIGLVNLVPMAVLMRWFPDKKGLATGLITMALALGTFLLGGQLGAYWVEIYGWSATLKILSAIFLVVVLGGSQFFSLPPAGYKPEGWNPPAGQSGESWGYNRGSMLKSKAFWMVFTWVFGIHFGALMILSSIVPFVQGQGLSLPQATAAMSIYALANGLGRPFFSTVSDKVGFRLAMIIDAVCAGLGLLGLVFMFNAFGYAGLVISLVLLGAAYGGTIPQCALLANLFFGPKFFPKNYGLYTLPGGIFASFLGPMAGGFIYDATGEYTNAIIAGAAVTAVSLVLALTVQVPPRRTDEK